MGNALQRLAKNVKLFTHRFGVIPGLIAFIKVAASKRLPGDGKKVIEVSIPQSGAPVYMRPKTTDANTFWQVFIAGEYDFPINFTPTVMVDAGAHIGYASLYMLHRYPDVKIVAIEPESSNAEMYRRNLESRPNVKLYNAALWSNKAKLNIENPDADSWSFRIEENTSGEGLVEAVTIPEILEDTGHIDILKIDIEGAEKELFSGDTSWLDKVKMVILELHERYAPGCTKLTDDVLTNYGFKKTMEKGENVIYQKI